MKNFILASALLATAALVSPALASESSAQRAMCIKEHVCGGDVAARKALDRRMSQRADADAHRKAYTLDRKGNMQLDRRSARADADLQRRSLDRKALDRKALDRRGRSVIV